MTGYEESGKKIWLCPSCGEDIGDPEEPICNKCGWQPGELLSEEELKEAFNEFYDDKVRDIGWEAAMAIPLSEIT